MKSLHFSLVVVSLLMFGSVLTASGTLTTPESKIQLLTGKPTYVPGEKIQIIGAFSPNDLIHIDLVNPADGTKNSTLLQSDNTGHFRTNYIVPHDAVNGTWMILATSGLSHASMDIQVLSSNYGIKNETGNVMGSMQFHGNLPITQNLPQSYTDTTVITLESPLKQFKSGTDPYFVICNQNLQLVIKSSDNSPACVRFSSIERLLKQGWVNAYDNNGKSLTIKPMNTIKVKNTNFTINYDITENSKLLDANMDMPSKSLVLSLETSSNGTLAVTLPRTMIDAKLPTGNDDKFYVLANGLESIFQEIRSTTIDRTISIPFTNGTHVIEIIGAQMI